MDAGALLEGEEGPTAPSPSDPEKLTGSIPHTGTIALGEGACPGAFVYSRGWVGEVMTISCLSYMSQGSIHSDPSFPHNNPVREDGLRRAIDLFQEVVSDVPAESLGL